MKKEKRESKAEISGIYLNPRTDFGFKKIFMDKELLIDFLNEIIEEKARITNVEYMPNEVLGEWDTDRKAVFDLYCTNSDNEYFIVEMQRYHQTFFIDRSLFYTSATIRNQAPAGKWDYRLKAVYFIAILDFVEFEEENVKDTCIEQIYLYRKNAQKRLTDKLNMIFVELPKFTKQAEELSTNTEQWLFTLKNLEKLKSRPLGVQGKIFEKLFKRAQINKLTEKEVEEYKTSILEYDSVKDAIAYSEKRGIERGMEKGLERGMKKGMEKMRIKIAKQCLQKGLSVEFISAVTELSVEQIKDMSNN
jgi:predicted transposase/invertase (TIGR01784 family)